MGGHAGGRWLCSVVSLRAFSLRFFFLDCSLYGLFFHVRVATKGLMFEAVDSLPLPGWL